MPIPLAEPEYVEFHAGGQPGRRLVRHEGDPGWVPSFDSIPVISFRHVHGTPEERRALAAEVNAACRACGFFYARDTGTDPALVARTFRTMAEFFALPTEQKMTAHWHKTPAARGYEGFAETATATTANLRESFTMGDDFLDEEQDYQGEVPEGTKRQNNWPDDFPAFRAAMYEYWNGAALPFARALLEVFVLALGLPEDTFAHQYTFPIIGQRALHYPAQPASEAAPGLLAHADFSSFTLVCQEPGSRPALQVLNLNGHWVDAPPLEGCDFTVNVGDFLELASNGLWPSTVHRVNNRSGAERYSLPFFFSPDPDATVSPLAGCVAECGGERKYEDEVVGARYVRRVLNARKGHPLAVAVRQRGIPEEEWAYEYMQGRLPE